ncbi:MAG: response regulator [Bdellovibrio sp.]|nr:MAG: response regulator [Bdellovibrio sp.]
MGIKLVIVDDAPFMREVIRHLLEGEKIEVVGEAKDGQEAVEVILRHKPDVVLMDIVLPIKTGLQATREILKKCPETRVIACSTESHEDMVLKALEAGCESFIAKPFKKEELVNAILNLNPSSEKERKNE